MNQQQIRHAKSIARKIREHAQAIVNEMSSIESTPTKDFNNVPVTNMVNRFTHDMGYGVQDRTIAIEDVIRDTLGDLQHDTTMIQDVNPLDVFPIDDTLDSDAYMEDE